MKVNLDNSTDDAQIQILPLIDVIFCILTFFIIAVIQTKQPQAVNVDLPQAKTGTVQAPDRLIITLMSGGQITVGQEALADRNALIDRAKTYLDQRPDGLLVLNASQNAIYSEVISVLDTLREVGGARRVALATNPKTDPNQSPNPMLPNPYSNPGVFPGSNPSGLPGSGLPGSSLPGSTLFPDGSGLGTPGGMTIPNGNSPVPGTSPIVPNGSPNPSSPNSSTNSTNSTNPNATSPSTSTTSGPQDFQKSTTTIPLTPSAPNSTIGR